MCIYLHIKKAQHTTLLYANAIQSFLPTCISHTIKHCCVPTENNESEMKKSDEENTIH